MILSSEPDLKSLSAIKALICKLALLSFQFLPKKFKGIPKWSLISSPKSCPCPRFQKYVRVRDFKKNVRVRDFKKMSVSVISKICPCPRFQKKNVRVRALLLSAELRKAICYGP